MSSRKAAYASPPGLRVPACNVAEFLFSNPFTKDCVSITSAPLPSQRTHYLPDTVPLHKPIFIDSVTGAQVSWQRTRSDALRVARGLRTMDFLKPPPFTKPSTKSGGGTVLSPIVMVHLPNHIAYGPILFGVWAAGLTASTVNPFLTKSELLHVLHVSRPAAIFTLAGSSLDTLKQAIDELDDDKLKRHYKSAGAIFVVDPEVDYYGRPGLGESRRAYALNARDWTVLLSEGGKEMWKIAPMDEEECRSCIALVMWSSGTSGKSKGVAISHSAIIWQQVGLWHCMVDYGPNERLLALAPVYHSFGISVTLLMGPLIGASVIMIPKFELGSFLRIISTFRATYLHVAPPLALLLAKSPIVGKYDLTSVKRAISGGAPLGAEIIQQVKDRTGIIVAMGLGMTETMGGTAQQASLCWEEMQEAQGSTGRFQLGFEAKLVDDMGKVVNRGEPGEILLRSPMNFSCYLNDPAMTAAAVTEDGWYRSGDVGILDEKDNLYVVDRLKDVIKYKGLQVAPAELEAVLCSCPLVKDAGVVSTYSSAEATELPLAYVVPADGHLVTAAGRKPTQQQLKFAEEVRRHVEAHVAKYKYLRGGIVIVSAIPTSPSGKRLRKLLKGLKGTDIPLYGPQAKL